MKTRMLVIFGIIIMTVIPLTTIAVLERYENYLEQLEYEADAKSKEPKPGERSYIEPELKAYLEKNELDLREKVRHLHQDLPPSSYAVNLNHQTKEIEVIVENKQLIPKIEEMITAYPDDITIVITYGKFSIDTPWGVDEYCAELCDQNTLYGCEQDEVYVHGVCMTLEEKERAESVVDESKITTFDYVIESDDVTYGSQYQIVGGTIDDIIYDKHSNSLIVSLHESEQGFLQILIQTGLLHSLDQSPFTYFVLVDGEEVSFEQLSPILLKIPFEKDAKRIEIIGTSEI